MIEYDDYIVVLQFHHFQVIANSDCPLEEFASIERVREGILSSLHDAVFFIRSVLHKNINKF